MVVDHEVHQFWCTRTSNQEERKTAWTKIICDRTWRLGGGGICLGDEIISFWGEQKTTRLSPSRQGGMSREKPSSKVSNERRTAGIFFDICLAKGINRLATSR
jgi:hypothetical protein